jgi:hypothetical protein
MGMNKSKIAKELFEVAKLVAKKEVPEAFKKQWKNKDKDGDGKENEPKPDFLKDKKAATIPDRVFDNIGEDKLRKALTSLKKDGITTKNIGLLNISFESFLRLAQKSNKSVNKITDSMIDQIEKYLGKSKTASEGRVDTFKKIVKDHQSEKVDGVIVDVQTASLLVQIFDALKKPALKKKFEKMPIKQLADFAWKMVK